MINAAFLRRQSWRGALVALMVLSPVIFNVLGQSVYLNNIRLVAVYGIIGLAQTLVLGISGRVHFGIVAFGVVGAYAYAYSGSHWGWNPFLCAVFAIVLSAVASAAVSIPLLRLAGFYLGLATLGLWFVAQNVAGNVSITGGRNGTSALTLISAGIDETMLYMAIFGVVLLIADTVVRSRRGRELFAMNDDSEAVSGFGLSTTKYTFALFVAAGAMGGLSGALLASDVQYISPDSFGLDLLVLILAVSVIGGAQSVWGALAGAIIIGILQQFSSSYQNTSAMIYGLGFLVIILLLPSGVAGFLASAAKQTGRLLRSRRSDAPLGSSVDAVSEVHVLSGSLPE